MPKCQEGNLKKSDPYEDGSDSGLSFLSALPLIQSVLSSGDKLRDHAFKSVVPDNYKREHMILESIYT